jgi:hypothetical protein
MLLVRDSLGRRIYTTVADVAAEMGVSSIVACQVLEDEPDVLGIVVNLTDYTIGTDAGGEVNFFDFFDIDYNQYKYLLETRCSGALTKIRSALVLKSVAGSAVLVTPTAPAFDGTTITIVATTGAQYKRQDDDSTVSAATPITLASGETLTIYAVPTSTNYYFANNVDDEWTFTNQN